MYPLPPKMRACLFVAMMDWLMMLFTKLYNGYIGLNMNLLDSLKEAEICLY